ncbi:MAG: OmpH family outer membrane protein [Acidobacteriota bacterium]|nr:OmpH family outer membrane protein [Acidobacteriota bacterium]
MNNFVRSLRRWAPLAIILLTVPVGMASAQAAPAQKFGVINVGRLLEESQAGQEALQRLKNLREQKEAEAKGQEDKIKGLRDRINEGRLSLSEEKLAEMQKELEEQIISYQRFQDDAQREFQKLQVGIFENIQRQVMPIITAAGKEQGFTMIFNKFESGLVFAVEEIDITDLILEKFDASARQAVGGDNPGGK